MKTAEDLIMDFKSLARDQQEKVVQYIASVQKEGDAEFLNRAFEEEYVEEEDYSPSDIAKLNRAAEEARQGFNVSGPFEGDEAIHYLRRLREENG